jgi:hypothetical protein
MSASWGAVYLIVDVPVSECWPDMVVVPLQLSFPGIHPMLANQ